MSLVTFNVNVQPKQPAASLLGLDVDVALKQSYAAASLLTFNVGVTGQYPAAKLLGFDVHVKQKVKRWAGVVLLDGEDISSRVTGPVNCGGQIGQNKTATFQIKTPAGAVNPLEYINKPVVIDYIDPLGAVERLFTGWVETPTYNTETGRISVVASTLMNKRLDAMSRTQLNALIGGDWSEYLFDEELEGAEYAQDLLKTVEADLQVDARGQIRRVPWAANGVHHVFTGDHISPRNLSVTLQDAKSLVNKIAVNVEYRYTRLRHREREYRWEAPGHNYWGDYLKKPYPLVPKTLVRSAIESTGWELIGAVQYQNIPGSGSFSVNGVSQVWLNPTPEKFAVAADWTLANRFTQTITEKYQLSFAAPESVEVFGEVPDSQRSHGITAEFADDEWDDAETFADKPAGATQSPNGDWILDATNTDIGSRAAFNNALQIVLKMYKRELHNAHRKNYVDFVMPESIVGRIDTHHVVQIVTDEVQCIARVFSVDHAFDHAKGTKYTKVRLVLSRAPATNAYAETGLSLPARPNVQDQALNPSVIKLGVHLGNSYGAGQLNDAWQGFISNYKYYDKVDTLKQYPTAFIVDTPAIEAADRDERIAQRDKHYNVLIPNDPLVIINTKNE